MLFENPHEKLEAPNLLLREPLPGAVIPAAREPMSNVALSVVILCHNEAANLPRCIAGVSSCTDIVVVDDGSTDGSREAAAQAGARVTENAFTSFADQRNWAMDHAALRHEWVLHLDADEVMTPPALRGIADSLVVMRPDQVGWMARKVMLGDRWLRFSADYPVYVPRLVHHGGPRFVMRGHGDTVEAAADKAFYLPEPLMHYAFSKGWEEWRQRHWGYAEAEAKRIVNGLSECSWRALGAHDPLVRRNALRSLSYRLPGRPVLRFLYAYVLRLGVLDGRSGFTFCRAMSRYERMIDIKVRGLRGAKSKPGAGETGIDA